MNKCFGINTTIISISLATAMILFPISCKEDFLHIIPKGELSDELLSNKKGLEVLLIGCYSILTGSDQLFY